MNKALRQPEKSHHSFFQAAPSFATITPVLQPSLGSWQTLFLAYGRQERGDASLTVYHNVPFSNPAPKPAPYAWKHSGHCLQTL